jgi:hypothetical protein
MRLAVTVGMFLPRLRLVCLISLVNSRGVTPSGIGTLVIGIERFRGGGTLTLPPVFVCVCFITVMGMRVSAIVGMVVLVLAATGGQ